jgi:hypothetical protein
MHEREVARVIRDDEGAFTWYGPAMASRSGKLSAAASTFTTAPPGGGSSDGTSSSWRTSLYEP